MHVEDVEAAILKRLAVVVLGLDDLGLVLAGVTTHVGRLGWRRVSRNGERATWEYLLWFDLAPTTLLSAEADCLLCPTVPAPWLQ